MNGFIKAAMASAMVMGTAVSAQALEKVSLRMSWLLNVQGAGYVMAKEKGFYADEGLDVDIMPGGPNLNSVTLVATGQNTFGTNDISSVLFGKSQGMPLSVIGACFQKTPAGVLSLAKTGIKTPKDLEGKTLAFNEGGPWTYTQAMLAKAGVDMSKVKTVTVMGNEVLMNGQVDAKTAFIVNEPIAIELAGYPTATLAAADYGVQAYSEAIVASDSYVAENPKIVAAFMRATAKGWEYALDNKEETVKAVVALNAELDSEQQSRQLAMQEDFIRSEFTKTNGLCAVDPAAVEAGAATLHEFAGLDVNFDPKAITHSEFNAAASK